MTMAALRCSVACFCLLFGGQQDPCLLNNVQPAWPDSLLSTYSTHAPALAASARAAAAAARWPPAPRGWALTAAAPGLTGCWSRACCPGTAAARRCCASSATAAPPAGKCPRTGCPAEDRAWHEKQRSQSTTSQSEQHTNSWAILWDIIEGHNQHA